MAMDNQTREIRQILLGRTMWTQDGCLEALQKGQRMRFQGMGTAGAPCTSWGSPAGKEPINCQQMLRQS